MRWRISGVMMIGLAACSGGHRGGGDDDVPQIDAAMIDAPAIDAPAIDAPAIDAPTDAAVSTVDADPGGSHRMIADQVLIPVNAVTAMTYGLDIDQRPNDGVDNQLGSVLGSLSALAPTLDLQTSATQAIDRGTILWLFDLQAADLDSAPLAAMSEMQGTAPVPPPCLNPSDTVCRRHLTGSGSFQIDPSSPAGQTIGGGAIAGGRFIGGPGQMYIPVFLGTAPVWVPVVMARAQLDRTAGGEEGNLGGAIRQADIDAVLVPAFGAQVRATFAMDCTTTTPPGCGCAVNSTGATLRNLFDRSPADCTITDAEVRTVLSGFLTPDIDVDHDGTNDALSIGYRVRMVGATF